MLREWLKMWDDTLGNSFTSIGQGIVNVVPSLIIALLLFILGCLVGSLVGRLVEELVRAIKVDVLLRKANAEEYFTRAGLKLNTGKFIGALVKWFIIIAFIVASLETLGLKQVTMFLQQAVLQYIPDVIVAVIILVAGVIIADALSKLVSSSARAGDMTSANFLGVVTKWAIWFFTILAALNQLRIADSLVNILFTAIVAGLALAVGLAFGLGGQKAASEIIEKVRDDISHKGR
ncbi:MAG: hypothetical protein ABI430_02255 [Candidatus Taylorbacteria bacterium]